MREAVGGSETEGTQEARAGSGDPTRRRRAMATCLSSTHPSTAATEAGVVVVEVAVVEWGAWRTVLWLAA